VIVRASLTAHLRPAALPAAQGVSASPTRGVPAGGYSTAHLGGVSSALAGGPSGARVVQRWRGGRDSYRPAGEVIRTADYEVAPIAEATAKAFVVEHHYSRSYPAARFRFGLFRGAALAGVAVFSHPCNDRVLTRTFDLPAADAVELGRFVLLDAVPGNGETWFLARCFAGLRGDVAGVVSFSDPVARSSAAGDVVFPGHIGTIYQAHNAAYLGRGTARTLRLLPDGRVLSARAIQKVRARERGWRYVAELLVAAGAAAPAQHEDLALWLARELPATTRTLRHAGNHRYAWAFSRALARRLDRLPYPKGRAE